MIGAVKPAERGSAVRLSFRHAGKDGRPERFRVSAHAPAALPAKAVGERGTVLHLRREGLTASGGLCACLACGHPELYTKKSFPRWLGIGIVVFAALLAPRTRYLSLVLAAFFDLALYHLAADLVTCYACGAEHRGFAPEPRHPRFDREIDERLRYGERAVMGKPMREGGTAGAPEPEH